MITRSLFHVPLGLRVLSSQSISVCVLESGRWLDLAAKSLNCLRSFFLAEKWRKSLAGRAYNFVDLRFVFIIVSIIVVIVFDVPRITAGIFLRQGWRCAFRAFLPNAAGEEKRRFLSSFRTNSAASRSPSDAAFLSRSSEYC